MSRSSKTAEVPVHIFISRAIDDADPPLTRADIAGALDYESPGVVSMIRNGGMKLPTNKVAPLATLLGIDRVELLRRVMTEYRPEEWSAIESIIGDQLMTQRERRFLAALREVTGSNDVNFVEHKEFMDTVLAMVAEVADREIVSDLSAPAADVNGRVTRSDLYKLNQEMEALALRHAEERMALRQRLLQKGGKVMVGST